MDTDFEETEGICSTELFLVYGVVKSRVVRSQEARVQILALPLSSCAAAAAAAKSHQLCPTLCDPIDGSPLGSSVSRILQARMLERVAVSFSNA